MNQPLEFQEPFNSATLATNWSWVRENSTDWRIENGEMYICSRPGSLMEFSNNAENVLLLPITQTIKGIATRLTCEPITPYEQAGLLWYYDDDNYIKLVKELVGDELAIVLVREENAVAQVLGKIPLLLTGAVELRMLLADDSITGQYRLTANGDWFTVASCDAYLLKGLHAGLFTHGGVNDKERWARFSGVIQL